MNSDVKPVLIDPIARNEIQQKVELDSVSQTKYVKNFFKDFYYDYIKPNFSIIICILLIFLLLYIRYIFIQQDKKPEKMMAKLEEKELQMMTMLEAQKRQPHPQLHIPLRQDGHPIYGQEPFRRSDALMMGFRPDSGESFSLYNDPRSPYYRGDPFSQMDYGDLFTRSVPLVDAYPQAPLR